MQEPESVNHSTEKSTSNAYEHKLKAEIEDLQRQMQMQEVKNQMMRKDLAKGIKSVICYKHLLERNQHFEETGEITSEQQKLHLPFVLMAAKDSKENDIGVEYGKDCKSVAIGSKLPLTFIGDMDAL